MAKTGTAQVRALVIGVIVTLCGVAAATLIAALAALIAVVVDASAMEIFTVAGTTFGTCLTVEIALVSVCLAVGAKSAAGCSADSGAPEAPQP
jgi:hypothetical protein